MLGSGQSSVGVIQLALTPVFLLAAVAALLNVFSTRLGRVADRVDLLSAELQREAADTEFLSAQLDRLRRRSRYPGLGRRVRNDRRRGNLLRCGWSVSRHVAGAGVQSRGVRFLWNRASLYNYSVGSICNRNADGWTWAKGRRRPPTAENGRQKPVRKLNPSGSHSYRLMARAPPELARNREWVLDCRARPRPYSRCPTSRPQLRVCPVAELQIPSTIPRPRVWKTASGGFGSGLG